MVEILMGIGWLLTAAAGAYGTFWHVNRKAPQAQRLAGEVMAATWNAAQITYQCPRCKAAMPPWKCKNCSWEPPGTPLATNREP